MIYSKKGNGVAKTVAPVTKALPEGKLRRNMKDSIGNSPAKGVEGSGYGGAAGMPKGAMASSDGAGARGKGHMGCK